ncbi:MAG: ABC transporter permease [Lentisphaeria bacterium]
MKHIANTDPFPPPLLRMRKSIHLGFFPLKLAFYNLLSNPFRALLTILGMIAASTLVAWTVASYDGALTDMDTESVSELLDKYDFFLLTKKNIPHSSLPGWLTPGSEAPPEFSRLDRFCMLEVTCRQHPMTAPPPLKGLPRGIHILIGCDAQTPPRPLQEGTWLISGKPVTEFKVLPCVLSSSLARQQQLQLNDVFSVGSFAGSFPLQVTGIIEDGGNKRNKELWNSIGTAWQQPLLNGIYVPWKLAEEIAGGPLPTCWAAGKKRTEAKNFVSPDKTENSTILVDADMLLRAKQQSSSANSRLRMQSWTATGLSMLICFFIIFSSLSMGVDERVRQYALLRSVALTRRQLMQTILLESLVYGLFGWLGGLLSGSILMRFFSEAAILSNPLQRQSMFRLIGSWSIVLTGCCSMLGALAAAGIPAWRASRIDVLSALKPLQLGERRHLSLWLSILGLLLPLLQICIITQPGIAEMPRVKLYSLLGSPLTALGFILLAPAFLLLCQRVLTRPLAFVFRLPLPFLRSQLDANLWRSTGTVIALSLGLGFYMMIVIWSASLLKPFLPGDWLPDLFITIVPGGIQTQDLDLVRKIPGIKAQRCLPVFVEQCPLAEDLTGSHIRQNVIRQNNITLIGMPVSEAYGGAAPLLPLSFLTDKQTALEKLAENDNYCLVPSFFSELTGLNTGDQFSLISPDNPQHKITYEIAGIIRLEGWHWFSKFSGTRRHYARTAALIFAADSSVRKNFNLNRVNYFWAELEKHWEEKPFRQKLQKIAQRQAGQTFHVTGRGEAVIREESIQLTAKPALQQSIMSRTGQVISGMLRMPLTLLWIMSLAVANTALASIRVRRREIGIMRALGLSKWGLLRILLGEAVIIGLSATLLSLAYGIFAGLCSAKMATHITFFGGMGWNFVIPWRPLIKGCLLTLSLCLAAALIPALLALRSHPLKLLKDNGDVS